MRSRIWGSRSGATSSPGRCSTSGELARLIDEDAVTGVTSNPTIFAGAITGSDDYDDQLGELARRGADTVEIVTALMTADIQAGCDVLRPVWDSTGGGDGYVSVEVSPDVANDTEATVAEARDWVKKVNRPNLFVKVPATPAGVPAIRRLIGEGISINVTLIFSLDRYREVIEAYLSGLDEYRKSGGRLDGVTSVASFFVSRFDTEVDPQLEQIGTPEALELRGQTAVANARVAYGDFLDTFRGDRWTALEAAGARLAATAMGEHKHQEPGVPRHDVCGCPGAAGHRRHHAAGDDCGGKGPRKPPPPVVRRGGHRRGESHAGAPG